MKRDFISEIPRVKENEWLFKSILERDDVAPVMKKYIGKTSELALIYGKVYEVLDTCRGWYRIIDETGEEYLYPPQFFVDEDEDGFIDSTPLDYIRECLQDIM